MNTEICAPTAPHIPVQLCTCAHTFSPSLSPAWNLIWDDHLALWEKRLYMVAASNGRREEEKDTGI